MNRACSISFSSALSVIFFTMNQVYQMGLADTDMEGFLPCRPSSFGCHAEATRAARSSDSRFLCAGINRHEVENERVLRGRSSEPLGPEFCVVHREVYGEA